MVLRASIPQSAVGGGVGLRVSWKSVAGRHHRAALGTACLEPAAGRPHDRPMSRPDLAAACVHPDTPEPIRRLEGLARIHDMPLGAGHLRWRRFGDGPPLVLLHAGLRHHWAIGRGLQVQRHLDHFANRRRRRNLAEAHLGDPLLGHRIGKPLQAFDLASPDLLRLRAQHDLGPQAHGQSSRAALVYAHLDPQAGGIGQAQHRLPGHHGAAGFGIAADHHRIGGGQ